MSAIRSLPEVNRTYAEVLDLAEKDTKPEPAPWPVLASHPATPDKGEGMNVAGRLPDTTSSGLIPAGGWKVPMTYIARMDSPTAAAAAQDLRSGQFSPVLKLIIQLNGKVSLPAERSPLMFPLIRRLASDVGSMGYSEWLSDEK